MRTLTGHYERAIDKKSRLQIPSQLRACINPDEDGAGFYINLGDTKHTLSLFTPRYFDELSRRIETEFMAGEDAQQFERQFFSLAVYVEMDDQGRVVLPEMLRKKARLGEEVIVAGQKYRIDIWNRDEFNKALGIDWDGDEWPDWHGFLRMSPPRSLGGGQR